MLKKVLAGVLAIAMICVFVTACGGGSSDSGGSQPAPAASSPPAQQAAPPAVDNSGGGSGVDVDAYVDAMIEYRDGFQTQVDFLDELMAYADNGFESEDDLVDWCQSWMNLKNGMDYQVDVLAAMLPRVPEDYQEAHAKVVFAVAAMVDAMSGFEYAVDAALEGDPDEILDGIAEFLGNMIGASQLWHEAYGDY